MFKLPPWEKVRAPRSRIDGRRKSRGQSLVEFSLVLPIVLVMILTGLDFGRAYMGWVELNNVARQAANFAAQHPTAWSSLNPDPVAVAQYKSLMLSDAASINCTLPNPLPVPSFPNGVNGTNDVGTSVTVTITCVFKPITPVVSDVVGSSVRITASAAFPIRYGVIHGIPLGVVLPNTPAITTALSQLTGPIGTFVHDTATLTGTTFTAGGTVNYSVYSNNTCTTKVFDAGTLVVSNGVVPDSSAKQFNNAGTYYWQAVYSGDANNMAATSPCSSEVLVIGSNIPVITTALSASSGVTGASIHDTSTLTGTTAAAGGTVTYSVYSNNTCTTRVFDAGLKTVTTNQIVPNSDAITFTNAGTYYWQAVYSDDANNAAATSGCVSEKLVITTAMCTVPRLTNDKSQNVQTDWTNAGFTTAVLFNPLNPPDDSNILTQTIAVGTSSPCSSTGITVTWEAHGHP